MYLSDGYEYGLVYVPDGLGVSTRQRLDRKLSVSSNSGKKSGLTG